MTSLDENAAAVAVACTVVLLAAVVAGTLLLIRRRDVAAVREADERFLSTLDGAPHALALFQDQAAFHGSARWQVYLAACRELCFYLLGTDQVEKNFATRLRAAGRISPAQMQTVTRAMQFASGECILELRLLEPGWFASGLLLPLLGLLSSLGAGLAVLLRHADAAPDAGGLALAASAPFLLSLLALLVLLPQARGLVKQLRAHELRLQLFPLSLANVLERAFVDHRPSLDELPSVAALGTPHVPSLSLPPSGPATRAAL